MRDALLDHDARQRVLALQAHQIILKRRNPNQIDSRPVRQIILPVRALRMVVGRGDQLEVHGLVGVGADHQMAVEILHVIFQIGRTLFDETRRGIRRAGGDQPRFALRAVAGGDDDEAFARRFRQTEEEGRIFFFVHHGIGFMIGSQNVTIDFRTAAVLVTIGPEDRFGIFGPNQIALRVFDHVRQVLAGGQVAETDLVIFRAFVVDGVGGDAVIGAPFKGPEVPEFLARRFLVAVEQDLFRSCGLLADGINRDAGLNGVLAAGAEAARIGVRAVRRRNGGIVFLDAAFHLREQFVLQRLGVGHQGGAVCVLRVQMLADFRVERFRLAKDILPVRVFQPCELVLPREAKLGDFVRARLGGGRNERRGVGIGHGARGQKEGAQQGARDGWEKRKAHCHYFGSNFNTAPLMQ